MQLLYGIFIYLEYIVIISFCFDSEIHGGEVMRINMCAAIISMQTFFLIGAHVKAQQVLVCFSSQSNTFGNDADVWQFKFAHGYGICYINYHPWYWATHSPLGMRLCQWYQKHNILWNSSRIQSLKVRFFPFRPCVVFLHSQFISPSWLNFLGFCFMVWESTGKSRKFLLQISILRLCTSLSAGVRALLNKFVCLIFHCLWKSQEMAHLLMRGFAFDISQLARFSYAAVSLGEEKRRSCFV